MGGSNIGFAGSEIVSKGIDLGKTCLTYHAVLFDPFNRERAASRMVPDPLLIKTKDA